MFHHLRHGTYITSITYATAHTSHSITYAMAHTSLMPWQIHHVPSLMPWHIHHVPSLTPQHIHHVPSLTPQYILLIHHGQLRCSFPVLYSTHESCCIKVPAVSHQFPPRGAQVQYQSSPCGNFGGHSGIGTAPPKYFGFPCQYHSTNALYSFIHH